MDAAPDLSSADRGPQRLSQLYDEAVVEIYRYLRSRCGSTQLAEELTSATFVQAALTLEREPGRELSIGWLITVARNKLIDRWRRQAVADRSLTLLEGGRPDMVEPWVEVLDQARAAQVLEMLAPHHRAALTLRYLDDLGVPQCAEVLGKSVHATESLLARARNAFRAAYEQTGGHHD
jgi:RNA polymerase sigma-70 factor (ECF subfamily)